MHKLLIFVAKPLQTGTKNQPIMKKLTFLGLLMATTFAYQACAQSQGKTFSAVALAISADVIITQGPHSYEVEGPEDAVKEVAITADGETLGIGLKKKVRNWRGRGVVVRVSMPSLKAISIGGSGNVTVEPGFNNLDRLELAIGGSGDINIQGKANKVEISVAGSGDVDASGLDMQACEVSIAGSGDVKLGNAERLEVSIAGSGDVRYKGNPRLEKSIVGSGDVRRME